MIDRFPTRQTAATSTNLEEKNKKKSSPATYQSPPQAPDLGLGRSGRRRSAVVRPDDAVDQPGLRARRRLRAARARLLPSAEQRQERRSRQHGLHHLHGQGGQRRDEHEHELRRAGLCDELELREEREEEEEGEETMRERREKREEREERREKKHPPLLTKQPSSLCCTLLSPIFRELNNFRSRKKERERGRTGLFRPPAADAPREKHLAELRRFSERAHPTSAGLKKNFLNLSSDLVFPPLTLHFFLLPTSSAAIYYYHRSLFSALVLEKKGTLLFSFKASSLSFRLFFSRNRN
jgi:hypothetical protein